MVELLSEDAAFAEVYLAVAERAGMQRESLCRALSPKGNLTLKTLLAILNGAGLRLTATRASPNPDAGAPLITPNSSIARRTIMSDNESHER